MIALLRAECLKLIRQPQVLFWGFVAVPVFVTLSRLMLMLFVTVRTGFPPSVSADWLASAASSLDMTGNAFCQLFLAIGVAAIFHVDYRYATWRLLVPRAGRLMLWGSRLLFCILCLTGTLVLMALGDVLLNVVAIAFGGAAAGGSSLASLPLLVGAFAVAFLELSVLAALVSALTILMRSMIAAAMAAFLLPLGASLVRIYLGTSESIVPLPSFCAEVLRLAVFAGANVGADLSAILAAFGILLAWLAGCAALGASVFLRQSLSSE